MKNNQLILLVLPIAFISAFVGSGFTLTKLIVGIALALVIYGGLYLFYFKNNK